MRGLPLSYLFTGVLSWESGEGDSWYSPLFLLGLIQEWVSQGTHLKCQQIYKSREGGTGDRNGRGLQA